MSYKWHACQEKLAPCFYALFRIVIGIILVAHGWGKASDIPNWIQQLTSMGFPMPEVNAYLSVAGEFLGGLGLLVGLFTPLAAFGVACVMATAILKVHLPNGLIGDGSFEYPLTLFMAALFFMTHGGGKFSVDALWCKHQGECSK